MTLAGPEKDRVQKLCRNASAVAEAYVVDRGMSHRKKTAD